jgi:hypothetical protein
MSYNPMQASRSEQRVDPGVLAQTVKLLASLNKETVKHPSTQQIDALVIPNPLSSFITSVFSGWRALLLLQSYLCCVNMSLDHMRRSSFADTSMSEHLL